MLKLMIVDDEELERNGLKRSIDWNSLGIEVMGVYENGKIALDAIRMNQPDILLTDIRMPIMDGLALAQKVSEISGNIRIIFVSGYEDFNYAKRAVELDAYKYILKPYEIDEMVTTLKEIVKECEREKDSIFEQEILKRKLEESLPLLKERFCRDLLDGKINEDNRRKKK
jgi:two-component system response regulator YesN